MTLLTLKSIKSKTNFFMIKQLRPIILYVAVFILLVALYPNFNHKDKATDQIIPLGMFWLTSIFIVFCIFLLIQSTIKKQFFSSIGYSLSALTIFAIYLKLLFVDYSIFVHVAFMVGIIILIARFRKQKDRLMYLATILVLNLLTGVLSDQFLLSYFNSNKIPWTHFGPNWSNYKDSFSNHKHDTYYLSNFQTIDPKLIPAMTANTLKYKINTKGSIPSIVVGAYMIPEESFVNKAFKTQNQLNHQQGYIDICEYHARLIRSIFKHKTLGMVNYEKMFHQYDISYTKGMENDLQKAERLVERIIQRKEKMNEKYMLETEFGQHLENQKMWNKQIKNMLHSLEKFE